LLAASQQEGGFMTEKPKTEIMLISESVLESWMHDASTFALFIAMIGMGVYLDSSAMQWVGALMGFVTIISHAAKNKSRMTIAQARARLDELEAAQ
jgi:hypothetical protein